MTIDREARQNRVLEEIVKFHVTNAIPVGSRHIADTLGLSSATIRNVMFELESAGYVNQPHTSAGRIPTDLGYRKYVNGMTSFRKPPRRDFFSRISQYITKRRFFEDVIESVSSAISKVTNYTGIALSPNNRLYFDGTYHMLEQPEFRQMDLARDFLRIVEEKEEIMRMMNRDLEVIGTTIHIGRENVFEELRECTVITSTYRFRDKSLLGNIGVIGPMRMNYEEVIPIVESMAEMTTEILEDVSS